jgi:hypothetical protein
VECLTEQIKVIEGGVVTGVCKIRRPNNVRRVYYRTIASVYLLSSSRQAKYQDYVGSPTRTPPAASKKADGLLLNGIAGSFPLLLPF